MSIRMWRIDCPRISVDGMKGYFDIPYGSSPYQKIDVFLPEGDGPFPAIISIHGGGFVGGDKRRGDMILPMLEGLKKGYAVIGVNYRLTDEARFPEPVRDVKEAIRFIRSHASDWDIDPDRLAAWGGSAGGYMTLMAALFADEAYFDMEGSNTSIDTSLSACVVWYPLADFKSADEELYTNSVIKHFLKPLCDIPEDVNEVEYTPAVPVLDDSEFPFHDLDDSVGALFLGTGPASGDPIVDKANVMNYIHKDMPPMFIQHGSGDEIVPMQQSIRFARKANEVCGEERVRLDLIPGAIHSSVWFETEENLNKVFEFLDRYV